MLKSVLAFSDEPTFDEDLEGFVQVGCESGDGGLFESLDQRLHGVFLELGEHADEELDELFLRERRLPSAART